MNRYDDPEIKDFCQRILQFQEHQREVCMIAEMPFARPYFFPARTDKQR